MSYYSCPDCGASLDPGEKCDCKRGDSGAEIQRGVGFPTARNAAVGVPSKGKAPANVRPTRRSKEKYPNISLKILYLDGIEMSRKNTR